MPRPRLVALAGSWQEMRCQERAYTVCWTPFGLLPDQETHGATPALSAEREEERDAESSWPDPTRAPPWARPGLHARIAYEQRQHSNSRLVGCGGGSGLTLSIPWGGRARGTPAATPAAPGAMSPSLRRSQASSRGWSL